MSPAALLRFVLWRTYGRRSALNGAWFVIAMALARRALALQKPARPPLGGEQDGCGKSSQTQPGALH